MIPKKEDLLLQSIVFQESPSYTYHLNREEARMAGRTDTIEAVRQAVYLILNIERYDYVIYSWRYGIELKDLFGKPENYVCATLPGRIREALLQDDRIEGVDGFSFRRNRGVIEVSFTVHSKFGDFQEETKVIV